MSQRPSIRNPQAANPLKFISPTKYFLKKHHSGQRNSTHLFDHDSSFCSQDSQYFEVKRRRSPIPANKSPDERKEKDRTLSLRALSLPALFHKKFPHNSKHKNDQTDRSDTKFPVFQGSDEDIDSCLDLDNLKTDDTRVVSFGVVVSKVPGEEERNFGKRITAVPAINIQKVNKLGHVVRGRAGPVTVRRVEESVNRHSGKHASSLTSRSREYMNSNTQENEESTSRIKVANKKGNIFEYSLWSEKNTRESLLNNIDHKMKAFVDNMTLNQLKHGLFKKKYVDTVDIMNKHIPLLVGSNKLLK